MLRFLGAPKKSNVQWSGFCGRKVYQVPQSIKNSAQYGNSVLPQRSVYEWIEKLKNGRTNVTHDEANRTTVYGHHWGQHWVCTWHGSVRRVTIEEVARVLQISHGSAYELMHNNLGFIESRQDGSQNNSQSDETWVQHHYEPKSKRQSIEWKHPQSPCKKKFKIQPSAGKLMLTVFWDSQGSVLEHYQERGTTINSAQYSEVFSDRLKPTIRRKLRGLLLKGVVLLPLVWSTQRGIKGPSIHLGPWSEGSSACVARCSAENLLFGGHQEACATVDQVCEYQGDYVENWC